MKIETFLAFRYLTRKQRVGFISLITWISVVGIAVGVMALIVVLAVMSGFDAELKQKIVGLQPHIIVQDIGGARNSSETTNELEALGRHLSMAWHPPEPECGRCLHPSSSRSLMPGWQRSTQSDRIGITTIARGQHSSSD